MSPAVTNVLWSVCLLVTTMSCAKMDAIGGVDSTAPRNHVLVEGQDPPTRKAAIFRAHASVCKPIAGSDQ